MTTTAYWLFISIFIVIGVAILALIFINLKAKRIKKDVNSGIYISKEEKKKGKAEGKSKKQLRQAKIDSNKKTEVNRDPSSEKQSDYLKELKGLK